MRIAIIGGIGSGKSTVANILKERQAGVVADADKINDQLLTQPFYIEMLQNEFPQAFEDGQLNRKKLADLVFSDSAMLQRLNALSHPLIFEQIERLNTSGGNVFVEISAFHPEYIRNFDCVWLVSAYEDIRKNRVLKRDGSKDLSQIQRIINNQQTESVMQNHCTHLIINNGDLKALEQQVDALLAGLDSD